MQFLIVEDLPDFQEMMREVILTVDPKAEITQCMTLSEVAYLNVKPHVILLDHDLGEPHGRLRNGVDCVRLFKEHFPDAIIIGVSGLGHHNATMIHAGADASFVKGRIGSEPDKLALLIRQLLKLPIVWQHEYEGSTVVE